MGLPGEGGAETVSEGFVLSLFGGRGGDEDEVDDLRCRRWTSAGPLFTLFFIGPTDEGGKGRWAMKVAAVLPVFCRYDDEDDDLHDDEGRHGIHLGPRRWPGYRFYGPRELG